MRKENYDYEPVVADELSVGDVLRSKDGRAHRTVVALLDQEAVVRKSTGAVISMPIAQLEAAWKKAIPVEAVAASELVPGDAVCSKTGIARWTVVSSDGDYVVLRSEGGKKRTVPFETIERSWRRVER